MIAVDIRSKAFGGTEVLRDVAFEVAAGETVAILGPSGIGKTTLLRIVAGIDPAYQGKVTRPGRCAIVFQEPTLLPWRSARQNLTLVHAGLSAEAAEAALARVGLGGRGTAFPGQLSLGQQRRLALARAFAAPPEMLILDEPFVSLDAGNAADMMALTRTLIADARAATLFVTHSEREAAALADRVLRLAGSPATIRPGNRDGEGTGVTSGGTGGAGR